MRYDAGDPKATARAETMAVTACPICDSPDVEYPGATLSIVCPVCMQYEITQTALAMITPWPKHRKLWLSGRVRRHWTDTERPSRVTSDVLDTVDGPLIRGVLDKQNALLCDIASRSPRPGAVLSLGPLDCVVFDGEPGDELTYHVLSLVDRELLQSRSHVNEAVLTSKGWEHIERLRNPAAGNRSDIFVAMSFSESLRYAWEAGIRPGINAAGYNAKRVDSDAHNDRIDDRIIAGIRASYALVVDVTTQNAGAYFEAGFAMGLGRPVVWTVREDDLPNLHFDTRQFNHLVWSEPDDLSDRLANHLLAVFGRGPVRGE